jgi:hypothetical protein
MGGGLALDWRSGWQQGGGRGPAIVPGEPDRSLLIRAIRHEDPDLRMPEEKLPDSEIATLVEWVQRGAPDPREAKPSWKIDDNWWSLRPLVRPQVPADETGHHAANPIDAFIRSKQQQMGLSPSPPADRRTLIRRLYIELHGVVPTPAELDDIDDFRDGADTRNRTGRSEQVDSVRWEALVDRLLASPRFGERWARHWLDTIHFADTHGFEHDLLRPNAWRFRDYVIDSFNSDRPWPRFIREQLAADVFAPDDPVLMVALGFLGAGPYDKSAAQTAPMNFEYHDRDDLVTQTMAAFVSTTANCARCHAHKFDPISQEDYFALQAVFAGIGKGDISFDVDQKLDQWRRQLRHLQAAARNRERGVLLTETNAARVAEWERQHQNVTWNALIPESYVSSNGATLRRNADASLTASGARPDKDITTITAPIPLSTVSAVRLELMPDDSLPARGPGRADNGNFHLSELEIRFFRPDANEPERISIRNTSANFEQEGWSIAHSIDGKLDTAWGIHPRVGQFHVASFVFQNPINARPQDRLCVVVKQSHGNSHLMGRWRLSVTDAPASAVAELSDELSSVISLPPEQRTIEQRTELASLALGRYAEHELDRLPPPSKVYAAGAWAENELGTVSISQPRSIRMLTRGDLNAPGAEVGPGALTAVRDLQPRFHLDHAANESARRAQLANWIADPANPLTWRSIANRVWHYHFGRGLCDTPSDFGRMGGEPSHPELLDWLAAELRDEGGSLKHLHRLICTSDTYRQSSEFRANAAEIDPANRWLWRMSRRRLDADSFCDSVKQISGRLDLAMHGPGTPHFLSGPGPQETPALDYRGFDWSHPSGARRSIYRIVWRGIPDPLMDLLDFPDAALLAPVRGVSTSPLQALGLLNNEFVLWHSQAFARRVQRDVRDSCRMLTDDEQMAEAVRTAVRLAWLRVPTDEESRMLLSLAKEHSLDAVCRLLLNSSEFLYVD